MVDLMALTVYYADALIEVERVLVVVTLHEVDRLLSEILCLPSLQS
jgi:hypothetical protein